MLTFCKFRNLCLAGLFYLSLCKPACLLLSLIVSFSFFLSLSHRFFPFLCVYIFWFICWFCCCSLSWWLSFPSLFLFIFFFFCFPSFNISDFFTPCNLSYVSFSPLQCSFLFWTEFWNFDLYLKIQLGDFSISFDTFASKFSLESSLTKIFMRERTTRLV